ncbi:MAG: protein kinase [Proteobacteria bacterium]|nr:protein kinase [Pseudomonadota bacterium]
MASLDGLSFGRYRVRSRQGQGGMGEVYLGSAIGPDGVEKAVAIKTIRALHRQRPELVAMFLEEAKVSFLLTHPNIVQTYELGTIDEHHFLVMEWVEGLTLEALLDFFRDVRRQPLPPALALYLAMQVARALDYAHAFIDAQGRSLQIVHRDISPSNVLLSRDGQVKVTDFGLVKSVLSRIETEVGQIKGKAAYMAPEQLASRPSDARTDIFALGLILYEMLSGEHPFGERGTVNVHARLAGVAIRPLGQRAPQLAPAVLELVEGCLHTDPAARFASAGELGRRIDRCMREGGLRVSEYELAELVTQAAAAAAARPAAPHPFDLALGAELQRVGGGLGGAPAAFASTRPGTVSVGGPALKAAPTAISEHRPPTHRPRSRALITAAGLALLVGGAYLAAGFGASTTPAHEAPAALSPDPLRRASAPTTTPPARALAAGQRRGDAGAQLGLSAVDAAAAPTLHRSIRTRAQTPRVARLRGATTALSPPTASGSLSVNSEPWAIVFVDGVRLRSTPLLGHSLAVGPHIVRLENPARGLTATRSVLIHRDQETRLAVELAP